MNKIVFFSAISLVLAVACAEEPSNPVILNFDAGDYQHVQSGKAGEKVHGIYSYRGADGKIYTTSYTADDEGYRAESDKLSVEHVPTFSRGDLEGDVVRIYSEKAHPVEQKTHVYPNHGYHPNFYFYPNHQYATNVYPHNNPRFYYAPYY